MAVVAPPPEVELDDGVIEEARRRQRRRRFAIGGLLASLIIAGLALLLVLGGGGDATRLRSASLRPAATGALTPPAGQFLYIVSTVRRSETLYRDPTCTTLTISHEALWVGADGTGLMRITRDPATFISPADRAACLAHHVPRALLSAHVTRLWFAPNCLGLLGPTFDWHRLSSNPRMLLRQIPSVIGFGAPQENVHGQVPKLELNNLTRFLAAPSIPFALRTASYRAASLIPGVRALGPVRDPDGRLGVGLTEAFPRVAAGTRVTLIFDSRAGELLAQHNSLGRQFDWWVLHQPARIIGRGPGSPPAPLTPACSVPLHANPDVRQTPGGTVITGAA